MRADAMDVAHETSPLSTTLSSGRLYGYLHTGGYPTLLSIAKDRGILTKELESPAPTARITAAHATATVDIGSQSE